MIKAKLKIVFRRLGENFKRKKVGDLPPKMVQTYGSRSIWLLKLIQKNPELRFPHRKILEFLSLQYDYEEKAFRKVNLSTVVKECRLGKNNSAEYLKDLEKKGLLQRRKDGYRVWFKIILT